MSTYDKALDLIFRCCGISPSGTRTDSFIAVPSIILTISLIIMRTLAVYTANGIIEICFTILSFVMALETAMFIINNCVEPDSYMAIVKDFENIDNELERTNERESRKAMCIVIASLCFTPVTILYRESVYGYMINLVAVILISGPFFQHMALVERIRVRFSEVNNQLASIAADTDNSTASTQLDSVFRAHSSLQSLLVDVDFHYRFYNLVSYTCRFCFCVLVMYGYLKTIEIGNNQFSNKFLLIFLRQVVLFISQSLVCHACSKEANRSVLLAHRVLQPDTPLDVWEKVGLFSALAVDNKVHFTVGAIFTLDRALVTQTALTALSYLIIAVQLREVQLFGDDVSNTTTSTV